MNNQPPKIDYRGLFDNIPDGLAYCQIIFDSENRPADFTYIAASKNFERLTGQNNILGRKASETMPEFKESGPKFFEVLSKVAQTGLPERFEIYNKPLAKWFLITTYSSEKTYFTALFQDITGRKAVEKDLENSKIAAHNVFSDLDAEKNKADEANAKDEALLESIGEGMIAVDNGKKVIVINKVAADMLGWKTKELIGKVITDLPLQNEAGKPIPLDKRPTNLALVTGKTAKGSYFFVKKNKTRFPIAITATPILLNRKVIGLIEIIRDTTRETEVDHAKTEFVSLASHQLRSPTTAISWFSKMLLNGEVGKLNQKQKRYLENIYKGNKRMIELINALLDVSRIELGTFSIKPKIVSLSEIYDNLVTELKSQIDAKGIKISIKYQPLLPKISADPKLTYIIFQNLLANAIAYTPKGGKIAVNVSIKKQNNSRVYLISVADTGIGIPKREQDKIFTKLFRTDIARETVSDGTGLGLYIVKSILDHTGGKIWFKSPATGSAAAGQGGQKNKGTIFYVSLPLGGMKAPE